MALGPFDVYVDNDNLFTLPGVTNNVTGAVLTTGTVTMRIVDSASSEVAGISWPVTMPNINSAGDYQVTIDKALAIVAERRYRVQMTLDDGSGGDGFWDIPFIAQTRED